MKFSYHAETIDDAVTRAHKAAMLASCWTLISVAGLILIKAYAYAMSDSVSLLASLTDTVGDGFLSLIGFFSLRIAMKPADEDHRDGHGKAEGFFALFQASFLFGASVFVALETIHRLSRPEETITHHMLGIGVSVVSMILTGLIVLVQRWAIRKSGSLVLESDQKHYTSDLLLNGSVILALFVHYVSGVAWVDLLAGMMIALYTAWAGYTIVLKASDMLMDREISEDERQKIIQLISQNPQIYGFHDLRTRRSGMNLHISFDVELDGNLRLEEAHDITRDIEFSLLREFPNAEIIIHKDPRGDIYDARHKVQGIHH